MDTERLLEKLEKANYLYQTLLDAIPHPALLVTKDRKVIAANKIAMEDGSIIGGFCWRDWSACQYLSEEDNKRKEHYTAGKDKTIHCNFCLGDIALSDNKKINIKRKLGDIYWDIFWIPTQEPDLYLHYAIDITEQTKREERIKYISFHDKLTGLYNRPYFEYEVNRIDSIGTLPVSIIIGDVNGLKLANDVFGHQEGDRLLQKISGILTSACRNGDVVARYGGDEYAVILPEASYSDALSICDRIYSACAETKNELIQPSIALGCATKGNRSQDINKILKDAEDRMYRNKLLASESSRNFMISSLENSLYERSFETEDHAQRLIALAVNVGIALGLPENELTDLNLLARLHDIGKIAVPDHILNKNGKFTEVEYIEIKKHSEIGFRIAQLSSNLTNIANYILAHHEHWDGCGYPQGLREKQIPLLSRILSIADAYDAMTNDRPYRKAMSKHEAINELQKASGIQFDPEIVPVFISTISNEPAC